MYFYFLDEIAVDDAQDGKLAADAKIRKGGVDLVGTSTASTDKGHDNLSASSLRERHVIPKFRNATRLNRSDTSDEEYDLPAVRVKRYDNVLQVRGNDYLMTDDMTDGDDEASSIASHGMAGSHIHKIFKKINLRN